MRTSPRGLIICLAKNTPYGNAIVDYELRMGRTLALILLGIGHTRRRVKFPMTYLSPGPCTYDSCNHGR